MNMSLKVLFAVAALFLATGTAHADSKKWESSFRRCAVWKTFDHDDRDARPGRAYGDGDEVWTEWPEGQATITLSIEDVLELQKHLPLLKKCGAWFKCLRDREAGKVKHCYENNRRWR
jgi:hypothetical protein